MTDVENMGPIDYLVVEYPGHHITGEGLPALVDLVDSGTIRILDMAFLRKEADGSVAAMTIEDVDPELAGPLGVFKGAESGLLDDDDLIEAAAVIGPGSSAGIMIYENAWAAPLAVALRRGGAQLVASGRVPTQALLAAAGAEA
jgi:hypothetical protein